MFVCIKPVYKKYFIAVVLKGDLLEKAEQLKLELYKQHGLKGSLRSPAHITLHRPFQWKEEKEPVLIKTLKVFKAGEPFSVQLNGFGSFEPRVIFIDMIKNEKLEKLHAQLAKFAAEKLGLLNEVEDLRGFHPHITIAFRDLKKPLFHQLWPAYQSKSFSGTLEVGSIELLKLADKWEVIETFGI
jgi:2'-5' RNA ligase